MDIEGLIAQRTQELQQRNEELSRTNQRLQAEIENTQRSLEQALRVIQSVPSGVALLDAAHHVLLANSTAWVCLNAIGEVDDSGILLRLGDLTTAELIGAFEQAIGNHYPAEPEAQALHNLSIDNHVFEITVRSLPRVEVPPHPLVDQNLAEQNLAEQWLLIIRDVSLEIATFDHQSTQQRQAVVGQLAAGIAHDFNNILAVISLYCQLLQKKPQANKYKDYLNTIREQATRGASLVSQLLDFGRQSLMQPTSVDLVPFLRDFLDLVRRTFPENIALDFDTYVENLYVHVDPSHLQQVFMNLALNSRDAMPTGGSFQIQLKTMDIGIGEPSPVPGMSPGLWSQILVIDTGCGMSVEIRDQIFEPFFTTKEPDKGTGLGLAQVYGIIQQLGGEISVSSIEKSGTTFTIYLPIEGLASVPRKEPPLALALIPFAEKKRILVVEDEPAVRSALEEMLTTLGFDDIYIAENGHEALHCLLSVDGEIDLVLSDMVMPLMGGLELFEALRDKYPEVKMIISTGYPLENGGEALLRRGVADWVMKPFSIDEVSAKIRRALAT